MKKKKKKKLKHFRTKLDEQKQKKNNILYPDTEKTIEDEMSEIFEDDRPKSMEWLWNFMQTAVTLMR